MRNLIGAFIILSASVAPPAPVFAEDVVGVAKRVRGAAELLAQRGRDKLLAPGDRIRLNDVVKTGSNGSALLQLLDASVFTVGPKAEIRIDRFVYDPSQGQAEASASLLTGAMRFVSGQISKIAPGDLQIVVPIGTIGVRGTVAAMEVTNGGTNVVLLDPAGAPTGGALVIQTAVGEARLVAAGDGVRLTQDGAPPIVRQWSEDDVNALLGRIGPSERWTRAGAATPGGGATGATITQAQCEELLRADLLSPNYTPGRDVFGRPVAPADLPGSGAADQNFTIPLTIDALKAAGVVTPFSGVEGETTLGEIRIEGGRTYLGGELLDPRGEDGLRRLCRQRMQ